MTYLLLALLAISLVSCSAWVLLDYRRYFSAPALFCIINIFWTMPQAMTLAVDPDIPAAGLAILLSFITASLAAVCLGWWLGQRKSAPIIAATFVDQRLLAGTLVLTIIGQYFSFQLRSLPAEVLEMRQPSGLITIFLFFAKSSIIAFALAVNLLVRKFTWIRFVMVAVNSLFLLELIFVTGKRHVLAETLLIVFITLFFVREWKPRLPVLAIALAPIFLFAASISEYRQATGDARFFGRSFSAHETVDRMAGISFLDNARAALVSAEAVELKNGLYVMLAAQDQVKFSFGADYWNAIVAAFVPGQLIGSAAKAALFVDVNPIDIAVYGHVIRVGSTMTGFAESFRSFWYFGVVVFFLYSFILSRIFSAAMAKVFPAQIIYASLSTDFLTAVTHRSSLFVTSFITLFLFTFLIFTASKKPVAAYGPFSALGREGKNLPTSLEAGSPRVSEPQKVRRPVFDQKRSTGEG